MSQVTVDRRISDRAASLVRLRDAIDFAEFIIENLAGEIPFVEWPRAWLSAVAAACMPCGDAAEDTLASACRRHVFVDAEPWLCADLEPQPASAIARVLRRTLPRRAPLGAALYLLRDAERWRKRRFVYSD